MNKFKNLICLVLVFLIVGCATARKPNMSESRNSDTLLVGVLQQKTIGEPMIVKARLMYSTGFIAESDYDLPNSMGVNLPMVIRGSEWHCPSMYENGNYWCKPKLGWGSITSMGFPQDRSLFGLIISPNGIPIGLTSTGIISIFSDEQPKVFKTAEIVQRGSFKQELIYNGKSKDTIKIAYREFKDSFARPAFHQDLTYDMTESKDIGFRGMIIEVVEASNSFIKFIVKQPMTQ